ncbi:HK97 gp10 family phage protein [Cereibacter sphaeroides]|uniref:HK97 gp10 family phage protein n=1 Tax=Cereibacter sphaeroides TaxID=1063 RepID=A0AAX1UNZ7_CERSP|nr:HK97 gp10 family phage protein [Cereibacter sphaeroides]RHZ96462.1 HK97 gp10 family phage protein [Cereibacter sphaeroides]
MVKGVAEFQRRLRAIPKNVHDEVVAAMEKAAGEIVREMEAANPLPGTIRLDWTWGDAPAGAITVGKVGSGAKKGQEFDKLTITVFATAVTAEYPGGFPAIARWFEFGTSERFWSQRKKIRSATFVTGKSSKSTGRIVAQPFFYPAFRANRSRVKAAISRAVRRGFQKS